MKPFESKLRIMDIYIDTDEGWNLAASSISLHPDAIDRHLTTAAERAGKRAERLDNFDFEELAPDEAPSPLPLKAGE